MKDRFSHHASQYAAFRPTYPRELYDFILALVKDKQTAWDCGTGNGQVAHDLSPFFMQVMATDISEKQLENAVRTKNINYSISPAEKTPFAASTFDLITVGLAIHWFNITEFYKEVRRVAKPGAVLAVWGYGLLSITPAIDILIADFYSKTIGPYWDPERKLIDERYQSISFPFEEIPCPEFTFSLQWTLEELRGYLTTWSAVQKYIREHGTNPVDSLMDSIRPLWDEHQLKATFPLFLRCGSIMK